jgi:TM2 domain-containing membrane protein YozV
MKNKTTAAILSLFLGVFGVQFFYLGRTGLGIFMCMLSTFAGKPGIAAFVGLISFIVLLTKSDNEFNRKYNKTWWKAQQNQGGQDQYAAQQAAQQQRAQQQQARRQAEEQAQQQNREARARMRPTAPPQYQKPSPSTVSQKEALKQSALAKFKDFDYQGATDDFGMALAIDPSDVAVHWNLCCCYSLLEQKELSFYHLQKSTELGFKDYEKIKSHDALAFLRVQPEFENFARNGFKMAQDMEHSDILQQLRDLTARRENGLLSEKEFADMSRKLHD